MRNYHFLLGLMVAFGTACTERTPWAGEGTEGFACFPEGSCSSGLRCVQGICRSLTLVDDASVSPRDRGMPNVDQTGCLDPAAPLIDNAPSETTHPKIALTGTVATGVSSITVQSPSDRQTVALQSTSFCVEVTLSPGQPNRITVIANVDDCHSRPATVEVTQKARRTENLLLGVLPYAKDKPASELIKLTDGVLTNAVHFSFSDFDVSGPVCDNSDYVYFGFASQTTIAKVIVRYPDEPAFTDYLACWQLLGSPRQQVPQNNQWQLLAQSDRTTDTRELIIEVDPPQDVMHLALVMMENGEDFLTFDESFRLAEIEAYGSSAVPPYVGCPRP